jgi:midasin
MTLRDLFRWADRYRMADAELGRGTFHDWDQHLADEGYLLLGGRVRKEEERNVIREVISKQLKRTVDPEHLFTRERRSYNHLISEHRCFFPFCSCPMFEDTYF